MGSLIFHGACIITLLQGVLALNYNSQDAVSPNSTAPTLPMNQPSNSTTTANSGADAEKLPTFGDVVVIQGDVRFYRSFLIHLEWFSHPEYHVDIDRWREQTRIIKMVLPSICSAP